MQHAEWLQPTRSKASIMVVCLAIQCGVLLYAEDPDTPAAAVLLGVLAAAPVLVAAWSATKALALSSAVTLAAPFLVEGGTSVIYAFIVVLVIYSWGGATRPAVSLAIGLMVLSLNEIVSEVLEELNDALDPGLEARELWFIVPAVLEAAVISVLVVGLGAVLATTRRQAAAMVGLERANGEMALEAERHRIARDLHDVAAHHLSSIVVRTSTARKLGDAASLDHAVDFAGDTAAEALTAMRQIVTLLRSDQGVTQPGLADVEQIVETTTASGLDVSIECDDSVIDHLSSSADLALSRVVRESLANIAQHSDATSATVSITEGVGATSGFVCLAVADPGPTTSRMSAGTGLGLIGMRERIEPLGGTFAAGPNDDGGWSVLAQLPLGPPAAKLELA